MKNHLGRFFLVGRLVRDADPVVQSIMAECIILEACYHQDADNFEYLAMSNCFSEIRPGSKAPRYSWQIDGTSMKAMPV